MKKEEFERLRRTYPHLCCYDFIALPDGWVAIAERLLADINDIQPQVEGVFGSPVPLKIQSGNGFAAAFATFNDLVTWDRDRALALVEAIQRFNSTCPATCEVCGDPSVVIVKEHDGSRQQTLCKLHADERLADYDRKEVLQ